MHAPRFAKWFLRFGASLLLISCILASLEESDHFFAALAIVFGAVLLLVSFGFACGQSVRNRLSRSPTRQILDTILAWLLATSAAGLAVTDPAIERRIGWAVIATAALALEALYRALANRSVSK